MALSSLLNNAFPLPAPLTPELVALGLDEKTAATVSKVYISSAFSLKKAYETECNRAFIATSDERGYSSKELRSRLLTATNGLYLQALSKWMEEAIKEAKASLLRKNKKPTPRHKNVPNQPCKKGNTDAVEPNEFCTSRPLHAFPRPYPPPSRPDSITFVTHISPPRRDTGHEPKPVSSSDFDACVDALSRLSLGPSSPRSADPRESLKPAPKLQPRTRSVPAPKTTSQLSPSRPRPVSPKLDTSVALSHKSPSKNVSPYHSSIILHTQNIDIPRSDRRKGCPIPYRRPPTHLSTSPESPSSSHSRRIRRTPSLISDNGSEASSPSTPPDFCSMPMPTLIDKGSLSEAIFPLDQFFASFSDTGH